MDYISITVFSILLFILIVLFIGLVTKSLKRQKKYENIINTQREYMKNVSNTIVDSFLYLKKLDSKGVFESDDEVGHYFEQMKKVQDTLNKYIIKEDTMFNDKEETKNE